MHICLDHRHDLNRKNKCCRCGKQEDPLKAASYCQKPLVTGVQLSLDEVDMMLPGIATKIEEAYKNHAPQRDYVITDRNKTIEPYKL